MFVRDAKAQCPHLTIFPYDFSAYEEVCSYLAAGSHLLVLLHFLVSASDVFACYFIKRRWLINSMAFCTSTARKSRYFLIHSSLGHLWPVTPVEIGLGTQPYSRIMRILGNKK